MPDVIRNQTSSLHAVRNGIVRIRIAVPAGCRNLCISVYINLFAIHFVCHRLHLIECRFRIGGNKGSAFFVIRDIRVYLTPVTKHIRRLIDTTAILIIGRNRRINSVFHVMFDLIDLSLCVSRIRNQQTPYSDIHHIQTADRFIVVKKSEIIIGNQSRNVIFRIQIFVSRNHVIISGNSVLWIISRISEQTQILRLLSNISCRTIIEHFHKTSDRRCILITG
ncbi:hypothetical protein D3C80_1201930 [compost metagenome]